MEKNNKNNNPKVIPLEKGMTKLPQKPVTIQKPNSNKK